jgi:hypothetical protein
MENSNNQDQDNNQKKSNKSREKPTIRQLVKVKRDKKKHRKLHQSPGTISQNTATLLLDSGAAGPSGAAGNLQQLHDKKQRNQGIAAVGEKKNLGFACTDFLTLTEKATDASKMSRADFAEGENKTEKKKASDAKMKASSDNIPSRKKES